MRRGRGGTLLRPLLPRLSLPPPLALVLQVLDGAHSSSVSTGAAGTTSSGGASQARAVAALCGEAAAPCPAERAVGSPITSRAPGGWLKLAGLAAGESKCAVLWDSGRGERFGSRWAQKMSQSTSLDRALWRAAGRRQPPLRLLACQPDACAVGGLAAQLNLTADQLNSPRDSHLQVFCRSV